MAATSIIANAEDFGVWLRGKPLELGAALANRMALRVLPLVLRAVVARSRQPLQRRMLLTVWHTLAYSRLFFQEVAKEKIGRDALDFALSTGGARLTDTGVITDVAAVLANNAAARSGHAVRSVAHAAARADDDIIAVASRADLANRAAGDAISIAIHALRADLCDDLFGSVAADCAWYDAGFRTPVELLARPLWPDGANTLVSYWNVFRRAAADSDDWSEWIRWYDRRLRGDTTEWGLSTEGEAEIARRLLALTSNTWEVAFVEPATVNLLLREWLAELAVPALPEQDPSTIGYGTDESGRVVRKPPLPEHRLLDSPAQRDAYGELRRAAADMVADHGQRLGAGLKGRLDAIVALPEDLAQADLIAVWRLVVRTNGALAKHMGAAPQPEPDDDRLDQVCAVDLQYVVASANMLALGDPGLAALNDLQVPMQIIRDVREEAAAAGPLVEALAQQAELTSPEVRDDLAGNAQAIAEAGENPVDTALALDAAKGQRNIFGAVISAAYRWARATGKSAGKRLAGGALTGVGGLMAKYVWDNWDRFVRYGQAAYHAMSAIDWAHIANVISQAL